VGVHWDVMSADGLRHDAALARRLHADADAGRIDLRVHDYFSDEELWCYLAGLDVSVLPYRFGTHSGWLEACRDLGTTVVAPTCGYYADQGPVLTYVNEEQIYDPDSLLQALELAVRNPGLRRLGVEPRRRQRSR